MIKESVFKSFDNAQALADKLADKIAQQLQEAVDKRGSASLVVSGGSTPILLFKALSKKVIDWNEVYVTLADERWVDINDDASNEAIVKEYLIRKRAASAKFQGLKNMFVSPETGCKMAVDKLSHIHQPFDVVVLGMGNDGHTCSWFPCAAEIDDALQTKSQCVAVNPTTAPHARISLSKSAVLNSKQIYLHIVGEQKLSVYREALQNEDAKQMPIRAVLAQHKTPVDVFWSV
ncbi:6-phosphogluconolactonase [Shewanella gelidii]|uniref:6-phosphogluconolactonase n=1 Tax=Shewanella gelidii TaxID=1642821 RepID=A0A917JSY6_9GAMM|nr:6-phosphogluconolactonase [Shewanella gelidii]MCL1097993.1 6-phosphogluconolactonase [Shewanella gelidii]GGI85268.1 6-phosphogluconolactonase [Shewanella gelidii]